MKKSDSIKEIAIALADFQSNIGAIPKTESNPFFKSKYADLSTVMDFIREPLAKSGLAISQHPEGGHETVKVTTLLMHKSGEWLESGYETKPTKADPQGIGSAISYGKRYGLMAVLGLVADVDDDGNAASKPVQNKPVSTDPRDALRAEIKKEQIKKKIEWATVWKLAGKTLNEDSTKEDLQEVLNALINYKPQSA